MGELIPIVAIMFGCTIPMVAIWSKHQQRIEQMRIEAGQSGSVEQNHRVEELEDRVAVLERIITDNSVNVAAQIEALRDTTSIEELKRDRDKV